MIPWLPISLGLILSSSLLTHTITDHIFHGYGRRVNGLEGLVRAQTLGGWMGLSEPWFSFPTMLLIAYVSHGLCCPQRQVLQDQLPLRVTEVSKKEQRGQDVGKDTATERRRRACFPSFAHQPQLTLKCTQYSQALLGHFYQILIIALLSSAETRELGLTPWLEE